MPSESAPDEPPQTGASGRAGEIERLHADCADRLRRLAWAILRDEGLAADAVQEAFALLAQRWAELPDGAAIGWLVKTVQYQALNMRRKRANAEGLALRRAQLDQRVAEPAASYELERQEELRRLEEAIERLPAAQQEVLRMRLRDETSFADIAAALHLPLGTVLSRMRLALEKLRNYLQA